MLWCVRLANTLWHGGFGGWQAEMAAMAQQQQMAMAMAQQQQIAMAYGPPGSPAYNVRDLDHAATAPRLSGSLMSWGRGNSVGWQAQMMAMAQQQQMAMAMAMAQQQQMAMANGQVPG
jgi:hypothetical protein